MLATADVTSSAAAGAAAAAAAAAAWAFAAGAEAWVLSGNPEMSRHLGMRASSKKAVRLGGQKTMWLQYGIRGRH